MSIYTLQQLQVFVPCTYVDITILKLLIIRHLPLLFKFGTVIGISKNWNYLRISMALTHPWRKYIPLPSCNELSPEAEGMNVWDVRRDTAQRMQVYRKKESSLSLALVMRNRIHRHCLLVNLCDVHSDWGEWFNRWSKHDI